MEDVEVAEPVKSFDATVVQRLQNDNSLDWSLLTDPMYEV